MTGTERPPSIKDVAEHAGVSWKTVSNVMNGTTPVRPHTRKKVERAIAELGYRRSWAGRQLRYGRSFIIALAVPELTTPYFADLAHEVLGAAAERGYTALITETGGSADRERAALRGFDSQVADGIILSPLALDGPILANEHSLHHHHRVPLVLLGERVSDSSLDHVIYDNYGAARQITERILATGATHPLFLGADPAQRHGTGWLRAEGFLAALGTTSSPQAVINTGHYGRAAGAAAIAALRREQRQFDALICASDTIAVGALHSLRQAGIAVPDQVQVLGWDGTDEGGYTSPTLTTMELDVRAVARAAVNLVISRVDGSDAPPEEIVMPHRLLVRQSTATNF